MAKEESNLIQTKGTFKVGGFVTRLGNRNSYREGEIQQGKLEGKEYRSLRFGVKTSPTNIVDVELFGTERDEVYGYYTKKKQSRKFDWEDRFELPEGYAILACNVALAKDEKGKNVRKGLTEFDAIPLIVDNLNDGDYVFISGKLEHQRFENKSGETVIGTKCIITYISHGKEMNFEDDDFKELSDFEQEVVITAIDRDKKEKKTYVNAYVVHYGDKFTPIQLVVDETTHEKLAKNFNKKLKFGDWIKLQGKVICSVETVVPDDDDTTEDDWGGETPDGYKSVVTKTLKELRVIGVDSKSYEEKKYNEDDFVINEAETKFGKDTENPFKSNNKKDVDDNDELPL